MSALPTQSVIDLFGNFQHIIDLDAEIPDGTFNLGMTKEQLNRSQISSPLVDHLCLFPSQRMCPERVGIEAAAGKAISPRLFRTCAASTAYQYAGSLPHLATALLNHRSREVTEQHYNRARSITFSKKFAALVDELK